MNPMDEDRPADAPQVYVPQQDSTPEPAETPVPGPAVPPPGSDAPPPAWASWYPPAAPYGTPEVLSSHEAPRNRHRRTMALLVVGSMLVGAGLGAAGHFAVTGLGSSSASAGSGSTSGGSGNGSGGSGGSGGSNDGSGGYYDDPNDGYQGQLPNSPYGDGLGNAAGAQTYASAAQQVGVVDINTVLGYAGGQAAGTGMVLTSNGEILTNNHVIAGATSIKVTVVATGRTYNASVVGYDTVDDVAVLQLSGASGLQTVSTNSSLPSVGDRVVGVGNAGGQGGTPSAASGTVIALGRNISVNADNGGVENLKNMIETNAPIQAGDSGGPLLDTSNKVVGMDTAASASGAIQGFAIPIGTALSIAHQIESGQAGGNVHLGASAFLGIEVSASTSTALVQGVISGTPAAELGLTAGDTITEVDGHNVTTPASLTAILGNEKVGNRVTIKWVDSYGVPHSGSVTLAAGPAV